MEGGGSYDNNNNNNFHDGDVELSRTKGSRVAMETPGTVARRQPRVVQECPGVSCDQLHIYCSTGVSGMLCDLRC